MGITYLSYVTIGFFYLYQPVFTGILMVPELVKVIHDKCCRLVTDIILDLC